MGTRKSVSGLHFRFICLIHYADLTTRVDDFTAKNSTLSKSLSDTFKLLLCQQDLIISRFLRKGAETRDALKKAVVEEVLLCFLLYTKIIK